MALAKHWNVSEKVKVIKIVSVSVSNNYYALRILFRIVLYASLI